jgi:hypothetical protein
MKNIARGAALALTFLSWSAVAEEQGAVHGKAPTEEQCKAMAVQHGMKGEQVDAWVKKCVEMSEKMKSDRGMGDNNDMNDTSDSNDGSDMQDTEDGDSGMSGDGK